MFREKILMIAYQACSGKGLIWEQNPFRYRNAIRLITVVVLLHLLQIISLLKKNIFLSIRHTTSEQYLIFIGICVLCIFSIEKVFSKKILAKSIRLYKEAPIANHSKLIAFGYLVLNFIILSVIINFNR